MTEREDIALELARKICGALPLLREAVSSDLDAVAALLRPHVCREEILESAAKIAEQHNENHAVNRDNQFRNCGLAIASGIRDLKAALPSAPLSLESAGETKEKA